MLNPDRFFYKIILVITGLCLGIIIAELIASVYIKYSKLDKKIEYMEDKAEHHLNPKIGANDGELGWGLQPNATERMITSEFDIIYSINSHGLRDREITFDKSDKEFRIIALGESTVFGEGISYGKRFTEIIEQMLNNVEVINMGVWGFGMDQSFLMLLRDAFRCKPDTVVLFIHEDFLERCKDFYRTNAFKPRFILNEYKNALILQDMNTVKNLYGNLYLPRQNTALKKIDKKENNSLLHKSRLFAIMNYHIKNSALDNNLKEKDKSRWNEIMDDLAITAQLRKDYDINEFRKLIFLLFEEYKKSCDTHNANFLVINIDDHKIDYVSNFCHESGITYLDLSGVLKRASSLKPLRFDIDPHYSEFAHRIIGEYAAEYFRIYYGLQKNASSSYQFLGKF